jgi:organic radical activating enzyme
MTGRISEVFESIQGEGLYLGERQIFVRLFGCNLDCKFCDTKLSEFRQYHPQELLQELKTFQDNCHSVTFTGGEPLLQKDFLKEVLPLTRQAGFRNYLETNGTLPEALAQVIDYLDIVAMDLKLPTSTGLKSFWDVHRRFLRISSAKEVFLKAVICQSTQEHDLRQSISIIREINPAVVLVLQPDSTEDYSLIRQKLDIFKGICMEENIAACILPQVHKIVGVK